MSGTTNKKKTAATKGKPGRTGKQSNRKSKEDELGFIQTEVVIIVSFAAAALLLLSNFRLCGVVGDFLRGIQLGVFGAVGYMAPVLLFAGIFFYMSNRGNKRAIIKLAAVLGAMLTLCALAQLLFGEPFAAGQKITEFYNVSSVNGKGGGLIGGALALALSGTLGRVGAYLILLVALIICIVCITERSFVNAVKKGGGKAYEYAKEDMDRRKEIHAERQEEKRRLREEQRVRGVNLDATRIEDLSKLSEAAAKDRKEQEIKAEALTAEEEAALASLSASKPAEPETAAAQNSADIFRGNIALPPEYGEDDTAPFDTDEIYPVKSTRTLEEMEVVEDNFHPIGRGEAGPDRIKKGPETGVNYDSFFIPEEPKRVVTASGKVIETDTEALQKKLESKKTETAVKEESSVEIQIAQVEEVKKEYIVPPTSLLKKGSRAAGSFSDKEYKDTAIKLQQTLKNFGVGVTVTNISCGPSVTRYELHPEQGVKVSRIVGLADDIKLSLAAADIRIEAPIPGKSAVGIEVPNKENNMVYLRDLFESEEFKKHTSKIAFAVGKDIGGQVVVTDIGKMPHLLIAGATGSGKSVCINTLIMSIIYKADPEDVKLIMVDPKVVELSVYNGIPHLMIPVVTDPKKASGALNWAVAEMTDRYKKFADYNVRDLKGYNAKVESVKEIEDGNKPKKLPQIIIIIDELADLMMVAPGEVEDSICRLAQLARAAGIHLVIATQRPSVNVITGLIKANVPSRIAFSVSSGVDSRTIIDMNGAEKLLGKGDMLFYPSGYPKPMRVQGAFVSDQEVSRVVDFLTEQGMTSEYNPEVESRISAPAQPEAKDAGNGRDEYFAQAGKFIIEKEKASIGMLQRMFKIGFNRAARIMDQLAEAGVVGEEEGTKPRKVLMTAEEFEEIIG